MHVRCPHCQNPIEVVADSDLNDVTCPSCGSHFNLAADETVSYRPSMEVIGHFQVVERLGMGHFGTVWKAHDPQLDRIVAIKIPRFEQLDSRQTEQFVREARAAAQLRHPNIVTVHEVGRHEGSIYIVSDFVQGLTLADWLTGQRPTIREAVELCIKVAGALEHAHAAGIVHRDLKPSNIMIDVSGEPHLMDFGLAKRDAGEITMTVEGHVLGTPAYMSPEQARGEAHQADRRSDVYSLGVVLFELLTGDRPFRGNSRMLLHQVIHEEAPSPRALNGSVPKDLETICLKCLQKEPARRYATAEALSADLWRFQRREPITARPISRLERGWRWCRRNPAVAGLLGTVALLLVAGTTISTYFAILAGNETIRANDSAADAKRAASRANDSAREAVAKSTLASEKAKEAQASALDAKMHAEKEAELLKETERQLRVVTAERLAGMSQAVHSQLPHIGLALAVESSLLTQPDGGELLPTSHQALIDALSISTGGQQLRGHAGEITAVTISPDSRWLATGSDDGAARIWDLESQQPASDPLVLTGHEKRIYSLSFSRNGRWLAAVGEDRATVRAWDLQIDAPNARPLVFQSGQAPIVSVRFTPDSRLLSTRDKLADNVWRLQKDSEATPIVLERRGDWLSDHQGAMISQDGRRLISISRKNLWLVDLKSDRFREMVPVALEMDSDLLNAAASPDSHWLATVETNGSVRLWNLDVDKPLDNRLRLDKLDHPATAAMALSPDDRWLVVGSMPGVPPAASYWKLWDLAAREPQFSSKPASSFLAFSPDSRWFVTRDTSGIALTDLHSKALSASARMLSDSQDSRHLAISADSRWLAATGGDNALRVWDLRAEHPEASLRLLKGHQHTINEVKISADGHWVISDSEDGTVRVWNLNQISLTSRVFSGRSVALSPNGRWLLTSNSSRAARLWDLHGENRTDHPRLLTGHQGRINSLAVSRDGRWLVSGSEDKTARIWNLRSDDPVGTCRVLAGHHGEITRVAISSDSRILITGSRDNTARAWDLEAEDPAKASRLVAEHPTAISTLAISPDSRWLLTGAELPMMGGMMGNVPGPRNLLWDLHAANPLDNPRVPQRYYSSPPGSAVSPDGRWIVTGADQSFSNTSVQLWDLQLEIPVTPTHTLTGHQGFVNCVAYSTDSRWAITGSGDGTVRMWDLKAANPSASTRIVARLARGVTTALLTPDGRWLVTAAEGDSVVQLSRWRPEDLAELAEAEGRNLTIEEWEQYFPGLAYRKTFPALPGPLDLPPQAAHGKAHLQRGNEFLARGEFETALDDYTAAIRLDPRNAEALDGRAVIGATAPDESFRDGARAVADAQRACELTDWKEPRYLATLAAAHAETGDFDQAVKWQAKARELADKEQQAEFTDRLKLYQSGSPYRRVPPATP